jgi:hypothetical protein
MPEPSGTPFVMYGARDAIAAGLTHIEQQVVSIERAVLENPGLAFDLAKTLVESVCHRVLIERGVAYNDEDKLPTLFRAVSRCLPFLPPSASTHTDVRNSLDRTLGGLQAVVQGICELRNRCGFASHGSADSRPLMETVQAMLAAQAADTIVGFLYRIHHQDRTPDHIQQISYSEKPAFNDWVDETRGTIRVFEAEFRPSEVLFEMEPESYRIYLAEFEDRADSESGIAGNSEATQ